VAVTGAGNVGIGTSNPSERLEVVGNIELQSSLKGVVLNAGDRPLITRGWDAFTSGNYNGIGRWGVFMEPFRLTFGVPNNVGAAFAFSAYETNSNRNDVLTINRVGGVVRPGTNNVDLLPICMGNINASGGIVSGTGNFSVAYNGSEATLDITIAGHAYNRTNYLAIATCYRELGSKSFATVVENAGKLRIWRITDGGSEGNQAVSFIVYKLN
jgi:hypothetical protein